MGSILNGREFDHIKRQHGQEVAEAADRGEYPHLVRWLRMPLKVSDSDSEEVARAVRHAPPQRPAGQQTARPVTSRTFTPRPKSAAIAAPPEASAKATVVEAPKPNRPILNPIQARFACIAWDVQKHVRHSPTQTELEIIREKIFFGGNFFAAMSVLERLGAVVRDDDGATVRYRILLPRIPQLGLGDSRISQMAVAGNASERAVEEEGDSD